MTEKFVWNRESVHLLIDNYKKHVLLYDNKHQHYKNRSKRLEALEEILDVVVKKCPFAANQGINTEDIKQKIHTLRTQYFKEVNKIKDSTETNQLYVPKLWCFNKLSFLENCGAVRNHVVYLKTETNEISNEQVHQHDDDGEVVSFGSFEDLTNMESSIDEQVTEDDSMSNVPSKKFKPDVEFINNKTTVIENKKDDLDLFGLLVTTELRNITSDSVRRNVKKQIFTILMDAQDKEENGT